MVSVQANIPGLIESIHQAEISAGRATGSVKLVAVSKTQPLEKIRDAIRAGLHDFGENRVSEMLGKYQEFAEDQNPLFGDINWHFIGRLQRNKVKRIVPFVHLIHSVDSAELLGEISKESLKNERVTSCLLQINISDEEQKGGMQEEDAIAILKNISEYPSVEILGLMGMAEFTDNHFRIRSQFQRLARAGEMFQRYESGQIRMKELSMGMSGDYQIAIEEGATIVRIGSGVFGGRP